MKALNKQGALTLMEILIVIAIIALVAGILLPVIVGVKADAKRTVCLAQMRQLGMALLQYREDVGEFPRQHSLSVLVDQGLLTDKRLLLCPKDEFSGMWRAQYNCLRLRGDTKESYYTPFQKVTGFWDAINKVDSNPGILVCRLHGQKSQWYSQLRGDFCSAITFAYEGPIQRLRVDGSIRPAAFSLKPVFTPNSTREFNFFKLFTDEKMP